MTPNTTKTKRKKSKRKKIEIAPPTMVRLNLRVPGATKRNLTWVEHVSKQTSTSAATTVAALIARKVLERVKGGAEVMFMGKGKLMIREADGTEREVDFVLV